MRLGTSGRLIPAMAFGVLAACGSPTKTGVLLTFELAADAPAPETLAVVWRDETSQVVDTYRLPVGADRRLPEAFIEVASVRPVDRSAVAGGLRGGAVVCEGAGRVRVDPGAVARLTITLSAGRLPDSDCDDIPDEIDSSPRAPASCAARPPNDAGAPPDANPAGAADRSEPPEREPTRPEDAAGPQPTPDAGAPTDSTTPDSRPPVTDSLAPVDLRAPDTRDGGMISRVALLVRGAGYGPNDAVLEGRLAALGFTVIDESGTAVTTNDATGKDLIVFSPAIAVGDVNTKFRDVPVPAIVLEAGLFSQMGMTGTISGTSFGTMSGQTIAILNSAHALAAGLSGTVMVSAVAGNINWGVPASSASLVAGLPGNSAKLTIFAYTTNAPMFGLAAPARRVGFFAGGGVTSNLTGTGQALLDAAIRWAVGQ